VKKAMSAVVTKGSCIGCENVYGDPGDARALPRQEGYIFRPILHLIFASYFGLFYLLLFLRRD
jgi:hypothetical protein